MKPLRIMPVAAARRPLGGAGRWGFWTPDRKAQFARDWTSGASVAAMAKRFDCSKAAITRQRGTLALKPRAARLPPMPPEEVDRIARRFETGASYREIMAAESISWHRVKRAIGAARASGRLPAKCNKLLQASCELDADRRRAEAKRAITADDCFAAAMRAGGGRYSDRRPGVFALAPSFTRAATVDRTLAGVCRYGGR
jgi:transposase